MEIFPESSTTNLTTNSQCTQWHTFTLLCSICKAALGLHRWAQTTRAVEVQELPGIILPGILMHFVGSEVDEVCQVVKQYEYSLGCSNISQQCWLSPIWALVSGFGSYKVGHPHSERILEHSDPKLSPNLLTEAATKMHWPDTCRSCEICFMNTFKYSM